MPNIESNNVGSTQVKPGVLVLEVGNGNAESATRLADFGHGAVVPNDKLTEMLGIEMPQTDVGDQVVDMGHFAQTEVVFENPDCLSYVSGLDLSMRPSLDRDAEIEQRRREQVEKDRAAREQAQNEIAEQLARSERLRRQAEDARQEQSAST